MEHRIGGAVLDVFEVGRLLMHTWRGFSSRWSSSSSLTKETVAPEGLHTARARGQASHILQVEPLPEASPLWRLENVLLAPHMGGVPSTFFNDSMQVFVDQVTRYARGEPLQNVVDKQLWRSVQYAVP